MENGNFLKKGVKTFLVPAGIFAAGYLVGEFTGVGAWLRIPCFAAALALGAIQYHRDNLEEKALEQRLKEEVDRRTAEAEERSLRTERISFETIQALANAIDAKDPYTRGHSTRVSEYAVMMAEEVGWDRERVNNLKISALLHDVGKIGVPDAILNKPQSLTDMEYDIIKSHAAMGGDILKGRLVIEGAEEVARSHHERYDGSGYPRGLKGEEISEEARIVAIADSFDAMNSNRIYHQACDLEYIRKELMKGRGRQFDPKFTDVFLSLWDQGKLNPESTREDVIQDEEMEASTHLLREAVDSFVSHEVQQPVADPTALVVEQEVTEESAEKMVTGLHHEGGYRGALDVDYGQFTKLYEYIGNLEKRFSHPFKLVLVDLDVMGPEGSQPMDAIREVELEKDMYYMEQSIRQTIRNVDVMTRYNRNQFLVILVGTDEDGVKIVTDRVFRGYYKMSGSGAFSPSYQIISA